MMLPLLAATRVARPCGRPVGYNTSVYRDRNVTERAFNSFKHRRGLATRYDKHAVVYRGGLVLAASLIWLADLVDTSGCRIAAGLFVVGVRDTPTKGCGP